LLPLTPAFLQFELVVVRLLTEEAPQHKRNTEDEILAAFQALDADKKGYLEQVSPPSLARSPEASASSCAPVLLRCRYRCLGPE
jgi:hypothetical protein